MWGQVYSWIQDVINNFSWVEILLISANLLFIIGDKFIFNMILRILSLQEFIEEERDPNDKQSFFALFRRLNIVGLSLILVLGMTNLSDHIWITRIISILLIISVSYLLNSLLNIIVLHRFGIKKQSEQNVTWQESYRSRLMSLLASIFIVIVTLILIVRTLGLNSILETGGILGMIGVFLALTQSSWAPDLIGGLVILNSGLLQEKDVIELPNKNFMGLVFKTKMFHTELLCLRNNHRVMIPNSTLRQSMLYNLSKFASAKGFRDSLSFTIGYDVSHDRVKNFFEKCFQIAEDDRSLDILEQHPLEVRIDDAGDYAVHWTIFYYIKDVRKVLGIRHAFRNIIVIESQKDKISLATPILYEKIDPHLEEIESLKAHQKEQD